MTGQCLNQFMEELEKIEDYIDQNKTLLDINSESFWPFLQIGFFDFPTAEMLNFMKSTSFDFLSFAKWAARQLHTITIIIVS